MLIEAIAAGVVGIALLWLVLQPMVSPSRHPPVDLDPLDPEETPRGQALIALREIAFDRATGKLSEEDYAQLNARYTAAAVATLDAPAASGRCLVHGPPAESDARFCPLCGAALVAADGTCITCHVAVPDDAGFCPGCGVPVRAG